jgi:PPM family protein phosphatase
LNYEIANETRAGRRPHNEDRLGYWRTEHALLMVLADGMGGHAHGALAAEIVLRAMAEAFRQAAGPRLLDPDVFLFRSIGKAHTALHQHAREHRLAQTPRTTIVACAVQDGCAFWAHVGDSRLYFVRHGKVHAQTRDQSLVQHLVASGRITEEEARWHPQRNVLLQCLGGPLPPKVEPSTMARLERGDRILLCSDGFYGPFSPEEIGGQFGAGVLGAGLTALAGEAEDRSGSQCDNLSALAMEWNQDPAPADEYLSDEQIEHEIERLRGEFRAFTPEPAQEYLSDEQIEREIERLRQEFRAYAPAPSPAEEYLSDEQIAREIERIRRGFQMQRAMLAGLESPEEAHSHPRAGGDPDFLIF